MYTDEDRYKIAEYTSVHGLNKTARHFQSEYATIRELTVLGFLKKYKQLKKEAHMFKRSPEKVITLGRGRPLLVEIDASWERNILQKCCRESELQEQKVKVPERVRKEAGL